MKRTIQADIMSEIKIHACNCTDDKAEILDGKKWRFIKVVIKNKLLQMILN